MKYRDIWFERDFEEPNLLRDYLSPQIYHIATPLNIRGEHQLMLTQIAHGTAAAAKEYSDNLKIFEPYWMN